MSSSSSRAVSITIGTVLRARSRLQTSSPSSLGSITSRTTRSTCSASNPDVADWIIRYAESRHATLGESGAKVEEQARRETEEKLSKG